MLAPLERSSDAELMHRVATGDREASAELVGRHQAGVLRFARAIVGDPAAAEDVLQDTFVAALQNAGSFRAEASVKTWLYAIARHEALRRRRRAGRVDLEPDLEQLGADAGWGSEEPDTALERQEARASLWRAFDALEEDDKAILLLRDIEGIDGAETARVLDLSLAAMKSRLHRARLRLVAALRSEECHHGG
jgi:RNA polymerase sigma-70 factor (ECF subfamily)